jgi:membrane protease YdiL (CAAX protease family)
MSLPKEDGPGPGRPSVATPSRAARRILLFGSFVTASVVVGLVLLGGVGWVHAAALAALLSLLPPVALAQVPLARGIEIPRLEAYASSAGTLVVLGVGSAVLAGWRGGPGLAFVPLPWAVLLGWTVVLAGVGLVVTLVFKWASMRLGLSEDPILRALLPRSPGEKWAFAGLSACAGFGEEMAYRGYVLAMLVPLLGTTVAVAVSSVVFGVLHAYQGPQGVLRTAVMGAVMAGGYLATGSLWPVILAHLLFDVLAGIFLADLLMVPDDVAGVSQAEEEDSAAV